MAQLLVRNLGSSVKEALRVRAQRHGRSMEEEVRLILARAAEADDLAGDNGVLGLGTRIAGLFEGLGLEDGIPECKGHEAVAAPFSP